MAFSHQHFIVLVLVLAFSRIDLITCSVVKGTVMCTDCGPNFDSSGIRVLIKCNKVKKLYLATTESNGAFKSDLPSPLTPSTKCMAKLVGGNIQLYALKKNMVSHIIKAQGGDTNSYALDTPLVFSKSCLGKCNKSSSFGSSKTFDLPIPPEYGFPPTSYYTPFIPIIGIP